MSRLRNQESSDKFLQYGGKYYAFDVEAFSSKIVLANEKGSDEIHIPKYELYKSLIAVVIDPEASENDNDDDLLKNIKMSDNQPFDFKLAFNTLIKDGIIIEL
jgi:hypothetical protein